MFSRTLCIAKSLLCNPIRSRSVFPTRNTITSQLRRYSTRYESLYKEALNNKEGYWRRAASDIKWIKPFDQVISPNHEEPLSVSWYKGGLSNMCYNALDVHLEAGKGDQVALIYDSPVTKTLRKYTYKELYDQVTSFAGVLKKLGVETGDRVIIYNPMIPETTIAMLACARLGAIHSVVFGGFSSEELATRIDDARPKLIVSASCGVEKDRPVVYKQLLDHAIELARHKPEKVVLFQRRNVKTVDMIPGRDVDWEEAMNSTRPFTDFVPVASDHPLYVLYTSGTTGKPKGVTRDTAGYMVALKWSMKNIFGINEKETFWAASDLGWVVGHSYILYGPLLNGSTTILYEGKPVGTPDAGAFWRVISDHKVKALFTAPTAFRAIKKEDHEGVHYKKYQDKMSSFEALFLAGERADPATVKWAEGLLKVPVIDNWWMTETGWPITANFKGIGLFPTRYGSGGKVVPGYDLRVVSDEGQEVPVGTTGNLVVKLPLPPGTMTTLWKDPSRFRAYLTKFEGYFHTGDAGLIDEEGYVHILSRTDDIINVAGHRLSTGHIEEVIATNKSVAECCVFAVRDEIKGELPFGAVVLKDTVTNVDTKAIEKEVIRQVREALGPVYAFKHCLILKRLPKTRSGKILRGTLKKIANGETYKMPATIDDPVILDEFKEALQAYGYVPPPPEEN